MCRSCWMGWKWLKSIEYGCVLCSFQQRNFDVITQGEINLMLLYFSTIIFLFVFFCFFKKFYLFIYLWLCWVFVSVRGLSLVVASRGHSSSRCAGLSLSRPLLLRSTGSRRAGSAIVAHGPSRSVACGIFPDQGSNPCPLHRQADSQPLRHQGSPSTIIVLKLSSLKYGMLLQRLWDV